MRTLKEIAAGAVERAVSLGANAADVILREEDSFTATVRMGDIDTVKESVSRGLLLRVFVGRRTATSYTSDLSDAVLHDLVPEAVQMARLVSEDDSSGLPPTSLSAPPALDLQLSDEAWGQLSTEARVKLATDAERVALSQDPRLVNSEGATFDLDRTLTVLANSTGFAGAYDGTMASLGVQPVASQNGNLQRDYWVSVVRRLSDLEPPASLGKRAAERTLRRVGAQKGRTCEVPVVFDPLTARSVVQSVFHAASGDAVYRRGSFLVDRLGQAVASTAVSIFDDALLPRGLGSRPFDDEGVAGQTTAVVENGVLRHYLHNSYSARKLGAISTANGTRSLTGALTVGPNNFYMKPGSFKPEEIIASVDSGLYVVELIGFGVNLASGDYSRGAVGIWIENGRLASPVQEVTIAGNLNTMLKSIDMIGDDLIFFSNVACPTLKVNKMVVSGT